MRYKGKFVAKAVLFVAAIAVLGGVVMQLWNGIMPSAFAGVHSLDYLHALGLLILCRILFGGFRGHGGWQGRRQWRRLRSMTPDEREQFLSNLKTGSGPGGCWKERT